MKNVQGKSSFKVLVLSGLFIASMAVLFISCTDEDSDVTDIKSNEVMEVESEFVVGVFEKTEIQNRQSELHSWLMSRRVELGDEAPVSLELSRSELIELGKQAREEQPAPSPELVGVTRSVHAEVEFSGLDNDEARVLEHGAFKNTQNSGFVWTVPVESEGAMSIKVHFSEMSLPVDTEMFIYNDRGQAFGPYTNLGPNGTGEFWTNTVAGSKAYIQLHYDGQNPQADLASIWFVIDQVGHIDPVTLRPQGPGTDQQSTPEGFCGDTAPCVVDATCVDANDWGFIDNARLGVAHYSFVSGAWIYICSGGLLADTDENTTIPYFLTANHCLSKNNVAKNMEVYFQFWSDTCQGSCYDPEGAVPQVTGGTVVKSNKTSDFTLLRLKQAPPVDSVYFGWTTADLSGSEGTDLFRVSHPHGAPQSYSRHVVDTTTGTCSSWPRGNWIYSADTIGGTQGGSSGSPVLNAAGQVVGQLSGACGTNLDDECDSVNNATVDGALAAYFPLVAEWLDPQTGGCVDNDGDGYEDDACGGNDCNDSDNTVNPGATEVCDDGIDNNCSGQIDEGCSGDCIPSGDPCAENADCCSNKCKKSVCRG